MVWGGFLLVGGWATPLKNMSSSIGMISNPIYGKIKLMFQTTNQKWFGVGLCIKPWFVMLCIGFTCFILVYHHSLQNGNLQMNVPLVRTHPP